MKNQGHTKTLFKQGKKYKWSYKHDHCIKCGTCNFKHKGRGLCTSCWEKERASNPNRIKTRKKALKKRYQKTYTPVVERKKRPKVFDKKENAKKYYEKNKEFLNYIGKARRLRQKGIKCLEIIINGKTKYLPFESFCTSKENYSLYKEQQKILLLYKNHYK